MIRRRQLVAMVSVAVVSFLVGTMVSVAVAPDVGNPFDLLWNAIFGLESRVEALEAQSPPQGFMTAPAYDSGWIAINPGQAVTLEHNLGTRELFVYMVGLNNFDAVHQFGHGGDSYLEEGAYTKWGAQWMLPSDNTIFILRLDDDLWWLEIRVYIWVIP